MTRFPLLDSVTSWITVVV